MTSFYNPNLFFFFRNLTIISNVKKHTHIQKQQNHVQILGTWKFSWNNNATVAIRAQRSLLNKTQFPNALRRLSLSHIYDYSVAALLQYALLFLGFPRCGWQSSITICLYLYIYMYLKRRNPKYLSTTVTYGVDITFIYNDDG